MPGLRLGGSAGRIVAEDRCNGTAFHTVVVVCPGAVQINPTDVFGFESGVLQCRLKGEDCALRVGAWRRHMVGIAACAITQKLHAAGKIRIARHDEYACAFADIDAVAVGGERVGNVWGQDFQ